MRPQHTLCCLLSASLLSASSESLRLAAFTIRSISSCSCILTNSSSSAFLSCAASFSAWRCDKLSISWSYGLALATWGEISESLSFQSKTTFKESYWLIGSLLYTHVYWNSYFKTSKYTGKFTLKLQISNVSFQYNNHQICHYIF